MVAVNTDTLGNLPGVKIREVQLVGPPIAGVGTSTPGFVGQAPATIDTPDGRFAGKARLVTSADQFIRDYINKIKGTGTSYTTTTAGFAVGTTSIPLTAGSGTVVAGDSVTFAGDTTVYVVKTGVEAPGTIELNAPGLVKAIPAAATAMTIGDIDPNQPAATQSTPLSHAVFGYFLNGGGPCYVVNIGTKITAAKGIDALERVDVQIIAAPGYADVTTQEALIDQATALKDRFAILDSPQSTTDHGVLLKGGTSRPKDSPWAAFYYPRIVVPPVLKDDFLAANQAKNVVAPTGHIAGIYGRVDALRGVHKAPANEVMLGALGVDDLLSDSDQDALNNDGVNAIRLFAQGPTVFGARTVQAHDADKTFLYISTRRLLTYVEQSLKVGLRFAVFEPNNLALRQKIIRSARGFLDGVWRDGALFGATADEAYYVRFPDTFNSDADRALGKLTLEVGLRVTYPAEFIIVRIGLLLQNASTA